MSEGTFYAWKAKFGGMTVSDAKRLKALEDENAKLKKLLAEQMLDGEPSGINRIYRLYREERLTVRKRRARRKAVGTRAPILVEAQPNARWLLDLAHDQLACGRRFRILDPLDDVTRECLAAIPDTSISGRRVVRELATLIERLRRKFQRAHAR